MIAAYRNSLLTVTISLVKQKVRSSVRSVDIGCLRREHNMWNDHLEEWQSEERKGKYNDCQDGKGVPRSYNNKANSQGDGMLFTAVFK